MGIVLLDLTMSWRDFITGPDDNVEWLQSMILGEETNDQHMGEAQDQGGQQGPMRQNGGIRR
ncbi:hypothetical protein GC093_00590 [Paenibacillus sp. LMG 31456]|uniref:Uncharacterized protein n=1 Tax=Paenibacillus foliorum TaxID=2654974 RepID=A0A972GJ73_9BACL|nr:hypothetical protein [Paenibacillus foliorum]NOU91737.1 hypothetical protein [Paenibacillus foliorum]